MTHKICKHFGFCGGCQTMDQPYEQQVTVKNGELKTLLAPYWDKEILVHHSPTIEYYRNKIEIGFCRQVLWKHPFDKKVKRDKTEPLDFENAVGFKVKGRWDRAVDIQDCLIFEPYLIPLLNAVRAWAKEQNLDYYDQRKHTGTLRNIMMRQGKNTDEQMIVLIAANDNFDTAGFARAVESVLPAANILLAVNDGVADVVKMQDAKVLKGAGTIKETIKLEDVAPVFTLSAQSFFQTNTLAAQLMYQRVRDIVKKLSPKTIYDFYGGAGSFSLTCADLVEKSFCIESVPEAVVDGAANAKLNNIENVSFVCDKVEDYVKKNKLSANNSLIIIDPPRSGMHPAACAAIAGAGAPNIAYISCNPVTLAKDLEELTKYYEVKNVEAFDFFPNTKHIETLVELKLK
ncbi:23S rRNA (uracil1939-C5)-methyltransferase [Elusimicrobium simillimum]|uniref:23S rRNA (uracil(1939)-C(5))-methyltransferase RlmD n=1 Tax=Elusimicrobium simillimum TaxID=3143438 RepID=UPI003C6F7762